MESNKVIKIKVVFFGPNGCRDPPQNKTKFNIFQNMPLAAPDMNAHKQTNNFFAKHI